MQSEGADGKRRGQRWGLIPRAGFLLIGTTDFEGRLILCRRELLVPCRLLSGIPALYPLDASGSLQLWQQGVSPDTDTRLLGAKLPPEEHHVPWKPALSVPHHCPHSRSQRSADFHKP